MMMDAGSTPEVYVPMVSQSFDTTDVFNAHIVSHGCCFADRSPVTLAYDTLAAYQVA